MRYVIALIIAILPHYATATTIHVGRDHMIYRGSDGKVRSISLDSTQSYDGDNLRRTRSATLPLPRANVPIALERVVPKSQIALKAAQRLAGSPLVVLPMILYDLIKDLPTVGPGLHQTPDGLRIDGYPEGTYNIPEPPEYHSSPCQTTFTYMQTNGIRMGIYVSPSGKACYVRRICPNPEPDPDPNVWQSASDLYGIPPGPSSYSPQTTCWGSGGYYAGTYRMYRRTTPMQATSQPAQHTDIEPYITPRIGPSNIGDLYDELSPPDMGTETLTSPTSITSQPRVTTRDTPDGPITQTETTRYDITYHGDTISITTTIITTTTHQDGTTTTTEETIPPSPDPTPQEQDERPTYDTPPSDTVPRKSVELTYQPEQISWQAQCPQDVIINTPWGQRSLTWWPICQYAHMIKPVVLAIASLTAILILYGIRQGES